jgi:1-acyl-sn-glycerol-3-phosphate acyltransferase
VRNEASARAGLAFRLARAICWVLARIVFGLRIELRGAEHLPRDVSGRPVGGLIAAPVPHVRWIDPFLLVLALPHRPRLVFLGDGRHLFRNWSRRLLFRLVGGVVPVWPRRSGAGAFATHIAAARQILDAGAIFTIFPEGGPAARPGSIRAIRPGLGYIGLRSAAPIVPIVIGGADELYRGRRLVVEVLPAVAAGELAGLAAGAPLPEPGTADERGAAHRLVDAFAAVTAPHVARLHEEVAKASAHDVRRWPWLTTWLEWDADSGEAGVRR